MVKQIFNNTRPNLHFVIGIMLITAICFIPSLQNGWVNWDDPTYVTQNPLITSESICWSELFTTDQVLGIYHPITLLTYALDYQFWGLDPFGYHLSNVIFHVCNSALVFIVFRRLGSSALVASSVALLFGLHPMHVESVSWISERKDVLYVFFLLLAWISYLRFMDTNSHKRWLFYTAMLVLFAFSILSKPIAFVFPLILFLSEYQLQIKITWKSVLGKTPIILMAILALFIAQWGQSDSDSFAFKSNHPVPTIVYGSYNLILYLFKAFVPINLSVFHPFPADGSLNWMLYASVVPFVALLFLLVRSFKKSRPVFFGLAFFTLTIAPLLQIVPFGKTLTSERYTYLPYLGIFYIMAFGLEYAVQKNLLKKALSLITIVLFGTFLTVQNYRQQKTWHNSETLWSSAIQQYPDAYYPYLARGRAYNNLNKQQKAYQDFNKSISLQPNSEAFYERGLLYEASGELDLALRDYLAATSGKLPYPKARVNAASIYAKRGQLDRALKELTLAISEDPEYSLAYFNLAIVYKIQNKPERALSYIQKAVSLDPDNIKYVEILAAIYTDLKNYPNAIKNFKRVLNHNPKNGVAQYYLGLNYHFLNRKAEARQHFSKAISLNYAVPKAIVIEHNL